MGEVMGFFGSAATVPRIGSTATMHTGNENVDFEVVRISKSFKCITIKNNTQAITCYRRKDGTYWSEGKLFTINL